MEIKNKPEFVYIRITEKNLNKINKIVEKGIKIRKGQRKSYANRVGKSEDEINWKTRITPPCAEIVTRKQLRQEDRAKKKAS